MWQSSRMLLANRGFRFYFFGVIISTIGDGMQFIGIAWLLAQLTGKTASMGWLLALTAVPGILFSPWVGVLVDRWDRRWTCLFADVFRGLVVGAIPLLFYFHALHTWVLYVCVFLISVGDRFYWPASGGLVREILPVDQLLAGNSLSSIFLQMGAVLGAGVGGFVIANYDPTIVMLLNAISFFLSAFLTLFIRKGTVVAQATGQKSAGLFREFAAGWQYLRSHSYLVGIGVLQLFLFVALYSTNVLLPLFSMRVLQVGSTGFGLIDAAWAVGAVVGGLLLMGLVQKIGAGRYVTPGMFLLGISILVFTTSHSLIQAVIGYGLMGCFFVSTRINYDTIVQMLVATEFQGRVKSTISMAISYISFVAYVGVGYLGDAISMRLLYMIIAAIILAGGLFAIPVARKQAPQADTTSAM